MIIDRIQETDKIFENLNDCLESIDINNDNGAISLDDKASKKIGNFSDNGYSWTNVKIKSYLSTIEYEKGIKISDYKMDTKINPHIIREEELEKWSAVITPYSN